MLILMEKKQIFITIMEYKVSNLLFCIMVISERFKKHVRFKKQILMSTLKWLFYKKKNMNLYIMSWQFVLFLFFLKENL